MAEITGRQRQYILFHPIKIMRSWQPISLTLSLNFTPMESLHILLVEDNEGDILLTTEALEETKMKIKLSIAKDGKEAIDFMSKQSDQCDNERVNLVLLDVNLPKRNGHEVLQYIKGNLTLKHIPVVMLTTSSSKKDKDLSHKNEASSYMIKPLEPQELVAVVQSLKNAI